MVFFGSTVDFEGTGSAYLRYWSNTVTTPSRQNDWMSRVDVDDLKDADYMASPYPSLQECIAKGMDSNPSPVVTNATSHQDAAEGSAPTTVVF
ncbi:hypothetical protein PI125_g3813 [Phytophthora idaei]|nr:hypothetical protein PI125_g3813 [Phytophthora idaei]KAG3143089.1 hypothetical protein PI126_g14773 [Phytophthora idaei]